MIKTLLKKQGMELFSFFWQDRKKNQIRTGKKLALFVVLYLLLFGMMAGMFLALGALLCGPLLAAGLGWLYLVLMGAMSVVLGAFGSIFHTYASLYTAKDNELLLALPVKPGLLLTVRLVGVYAMGLLYELLVILPALGVYAVLAKPGIWGILCGLWFLLLLSVVILCLSILLGWVVAAVSARTRHKSFLTVTLSLLFLAAYYYVYFTAFGQLSAFLEAPQAAAALVQGRCYPLYLVGRAAEGDGRALLWVTAAVGAAFALLYGVLRHTYPKLLTTHRGTAKKAAALRPARRGSPARALFQKELRRFLGSPNYMLNCGLGVILLLAAIVALLWKGELAANLLAPLVGENRGLLGLLGAGMLCVLASMVDTTAPSVSLEGKQLWLLQVLPVSGWQVLQAKLSLQLVLVLPLLLVLGLCGIGVLGIPLAEGALMLLAAALFCWVMAQVGLAANLLAPNLTWTDEIVPIKQSLSVLVTLFGDWAAVAVLAGAYLLLRRWVSPLGFLALAALVLLAAALLLRNWLKTRGAARFAALS